MSDTMDTVTEIVYAIIYIYFIYVFISSLFTERVFINFFVIFLSVFLLAKWATDFRKCTISYAECKIRGIPKEKGFMYNFMDNILNINRHSHYTLIQVCMLFIIIVNAMNMKDDYNRLDGLYDMKSKSMKQKMHIIMSEGGHTI